MTHLLVLLQGTAVLEIGTQFKTNKFLTNSYDINVRCVPPSLTLLKHLRKFHREFNASRPRGARARVENRASGIYRMRSIADRPLNWRWLSYVISGSFRRLYDCKSLFCAPACRKNVSAGGRELAPLTSHPVTLHDNPSSYGRVLDLRQSCALKRICYPGFASKHPVLRG